MTQESSSTGQQGASGNSPQETMHIQSLCIYFQRGGAEPAVGAYTPRSERLCPGVTFEGGSPPFLCLLLPKRTEGGSRTLRTAVSIQYFLKNYIKQKRLQLMPTGLRNKTWSLPSLNIPYFKYYYYINEIHYFFIINISKESYQKKFTHCHAITTN